MEIFQFAQVDYYPTQNFAYYYFEYLYDLALSSNRAQKSKFELVG